MLGLLLLLLVLGSAILAENALHVHRSEPQARDAERLAHATGASWRDVRVEAADGARLAGWLLTPAHPNGGGVLLLHGVNDSRTGTLGQARFLLDAGYAVLTADSRGHGASGGAMLTYGVLEAEDVHRWASLLLREPEIERLYGLGESMGAAILLESLAREPRFRAIAADCPFHDFESIATERVAQQGIAYMLAWPMVRAGFIYTRVRYGVDLWDASPARALRAARTPVLLIHGTADTNIVLDHSRRLRAENPGVAQLWEVAGAEHVQSMAIQGAEYARRVTAFFEAHRK
jgi:dipeptidyl aminopeptidase/acylaminoacyl peptidase